MSLLMSLKSPFLMTLTIIINNINNCLIFCNLLSLLSGIKITSITPESGIKITSITPDSI